jgi:hypothetical protein
MILDMHTGWGIGVIATNLQGVEDDTSKRCLFQFLDPWDGWTKMVALERYNCELEFAGYYKTEAPDTWTNTETWTIVNHYFFENLRGCKCNSSFFLTLPWGGGIVTIVMLFCEQK